MKLKFCVLLNFRYIYFQKNLDTEQMVSTYEQKTQNDFAGF